MENRKLLYCGAGPIVLSPRWCLGSLGREPRCPDDNIGPARRESSRAMVFVWESLNDSSHALGEVVGPLLHEDLALLEEIPPEGVAGWVSGQDGAIYAICGWSSLLLMAAARGPTLGPSGESGPLEILEDHTKKPVRKHGLPLSAGPAIKLRAGGGSELNTRRWLVPGRRTPLSSIPYIIIKQSRRPCPPHNISLSPIHSLIPFLSSFLSCCASLDISCAVGMTSVVGMTSPMVSVR